MAHARILLADNDPSYLDTCAEFLESAQYQVLRAPTLADARRLLETQYVHLAILDLRLINDDDDKDRSGLVLAKQVAPFTPKLILTKFPIYQDVREAMKLDRRTLPAAIDYVDKRDLLPALLAAVEQAFAEHVRINSSLVIRWNESSPITFPHLASLIEPGLEGRNLPDRAEELQDLFRRLFYRKSQIRIDRMLWQRDRRIALSVFAFQPDARPQSLLVVCAPPHSMLEEAQHWRAHAPAAPAPTSVTPGERAETAHFAANCYELQSVEDMASLCSLADLYRTATDKEFSIGLAGLLGESLQAWHGASRSLGVHSLDRLYRERLELEPAQVGREALETRVHALVRQIPLLNAQARLQAGKFEIQFDGRVYAYPDPLPLLYLTFERETPPIVINTPGVLSGDNILTDAKGRCWLTDFAGAGLAPLLWNYVSLEAVVRFDWVEEKDLRALHTMEQCLVGDLFGKLDTAHVEPFLRKPVRVIESIRRGAGEAVGKDTREYNLGMLFHAMRGLVGLDPHVALTPGELARFSHRLMAAAMIAAQLASTEGAQAVPVKSDFWLDKGNQTVWIEGKPVQLRGQGYEILCYLYDNANRLCKRREIIEQVLGGAYDEDQVRRLTTAINRLRDDIEPNPRKPRYLQTHPGAGYVLEIKNKA